MTTEPGYRAGWHFFREMQPAVRNFPRRRCTFHARGEQGAALVEMALAAAVLLTVLFGMMEISLALYTYHFVSEAAREGTRYAIVRGSSCTGFSAACPASPADIQSYVQNLGFPGIDPTAMTVDTVWSAYPAGGACTPLASCNNPGNMVNVTVNYQFPLAIPFIPASTLAMSSSSQMVISQ
jgi:Flp pilus assembly protein TadG